MGDLVALVIVVLLVVAALAMATSLQWYHRGQERLRRRLEREGRSILAEVPTEDGLEFFSEDEEAFYWTSRTVRKHEIRSAQVMIRGAPLASVRSRNFSGQAEVGHDPTTTKPEIFERERWDVVIDTGNEMVIVECGTIRENVSQELARRIYEAVKRSIESQDRNIHHSRS